MMGLDVSSSITGKMKIPIDIRQAPIKLSIEPHREVRRFSDIVEALMVDP